MTALYIFLGLFGVLLLLLLISLIRTLLMPVQKSTYEPAPDLQRSEIYAKKLSAMIRQIGRAHV